MCRAVERCQGVRSEASPVKKSMPCHGWILGIIALIAISFASLSLLSDSWKDLVGRTWSIVLLTAGCTFFIAFVTARVFYCCLNRRHPKSQSSNGIKLKISPFQPLQDEGCSLAVSALGMMKKEEVGVARKIFGEKLQKLMDKKVLDENENRELNKIKNACAYILSDLLPEDFQTRRSFDLKPRDREGFSKAIAFIETPNTVKGALLICNEYFSLVKMRTEKDANESISTARALYAKFKELINRAP